MSNSQPTQNPQNITKESHLAVTILLEDLWQELGMRIRIRSRLLTDDAWQLVDEPARRKLEKALRHDLLGEGGDAPEMTAWESYMVFRGRLLGATPILTHEGMFTLDWPTTELAELEKRMMKINSYSLSLKKGGLSAIKEDLPGLMALMLRVSELCYALRMKWRAFNS